MSYYNTSTINNYLAEYQSRKGKFLNKHNIEEKAKQMVRFKTRKHIDPNQRVSAQDVYKLNLDKKRKSISVKTRRSKGNDYKLFIGNNEESLDNYKNLDDLEPFNYDSVNYCDEEISFLFLGGRWVMAWHG